MLKTLLLTLLLFALPATASAQVDLNRADAKMLAEAMSGVGLVKAEAIVAYRDVHGPFRRIEDLAKVKGIGAKTIAANRDTVVVIAPGGADDSPAAAPGIRPAAVQ